MLKMLTVIALYKIEDIFGVFLHTVQHLEHASGALDIVENLTVCSIWKSC